MPGEISIWIESRPTRWNTFPSERREAYKYSYLSDDHTRSERSYCYHHSSKKERNLRRFCVITNLNCSHSRSSEVAFEVSGPADFRPLSKIPKRKVEGSITKPYSSPRSVAEYLRLRNAEFNRLKIRRECVYISHLLGWFSDNSILCIGKEL